MILDLKVTISVFRVGLCLCSPFTVCRAVKVFAFLRIMIHFLKMFLTVGRGLVYHGHLENVLNVAMFVMQI